MYDLVLSRKATRDLARLRHGTPLSDRTAIDQAIRDLADDPRPYTARRLVDSSYWRIRVRDYRIIDEIDDEARDVYVVAVLWRNEGTYRDA